MDKKKILKYAGLAIACLILFPISPLILGVFAIYKLSKLGLPKNKKLTLTSLTLILSLFLTRKVVGALPKPISTPKPEVKSEQTQISPTPVLPSPTPDPNITYAKVTNVVDGDTFKIDSGETVRLIGIDTPETVSPTKPVQCFGKEASDKLKDLVEGKEIKLEKDVSEKDKYGRLLRYVYINDILVNEYLVRQGFAMSSSYPPDVKFQEKFVIAQKTAQSESLGLWNPNACPTAAPTPRPTNTTTPQTTNAATSVRTSPPATNTPSSNTNTGSFACDCSKSCSEMSSCAEAQYQLNQCGCTKRDGDADGIACDSDCQ